jgi:DNA mismatch endonuclease (patch repair protein)
VADVFSKEYRSALMARIKAKDTKPEVLVRKYLHSIGFRYRLHSNKLPGKPDIVLPKYRVVIFVHGCYWHGHEECKYAQVPKTRTEWWLSKIANTKMRDALTIKQLQDLDWRVIVIYECSLKPKTRAATMNKIVNFIKYGP